MPNQKHWSATSPHRDQTARPSHKIWHDEADDTPLIDGPCGGYEAARLIRLHGIDQAMPVILERVRMFGGVTK